MDIITNKPAQAPKVELFSENDISIRYKFPDGYDMSNLSAKIYRKLDNIIISDVSKQPTTTIIDDVFYITFSSIKLKLLSAPFVLYVYDGDAAIIGQDCVTSNKTGVYNDIITQVVIGDETIIEVNAQLNPASTWGSIQGDITQQEDLIDYLTSNGLSKEEADGFYYSITNPSNFISSINSSNVITALGYTPYNSSNPSGYISGITSLQVTNALGFTPVSTTGNYTDPSWLTLTKSKVGLGNVLNVIQEPAIASGTTSQYWRGDKTWVNFPTIPTNNNQLTNGSNFITASSTDTLTNKSGNISQWTNNSGYLTGITSTQINTALGYTPYNSSNPSGYISGINSSDVTTALGYTPYNGATNPNGYITNANVYSKTEIDNFFSGSIAKTGYNKINWDTSFGWGNHASAGYTTATSTQTFTNKSGNISQWTNDSLYLTSITGSQINTALGYTPVNPNGTNLQYIAGDGSKITFPSIPTNNNYVDLLTDQTIDGIKTLSKTINLSAGTSSNSPIKFTSGSIKSSFIPGEVDFISDKYYAVITTGAARKEFALIDSPLTSGRIPITTTNGRLIDSSTFVYSIALDGAHIGIGTSSVTANLNIGSSAVSGGSRALARFIAAPHTSQLASTELIDVTFNSSAILQFDTGNITTQRTNLFQARTYSAVAASIITNSATVAITGSPIAGTNMTITNPYAFWVQSGNTLLNGKLNTGDDIENTKTNGAIILKDTATSTRQFIRVTNGVISIATS